MERAASRGKAPMPGMIMLYWWKVVLFFLEEIKRNKSGNKNESSISRIVETWCDYKFNSAWNINSCPLALKVLILVEISRSKTWKPGKVACCKSPWTVWDFFSPIAKYSLVLPVDGVEEMPFGDLQLKFFFDWFCFQYFMQLSCIRKCFTQKGGIFVLEEYSKHQ